MKCQLDNSKQWTHKAWRNSKSSRGLVRPSSGQWGKCGWGSSLAEGRIVRHWEASVPYVLIHFKVHRIRASWFRRGLRRSFKSVFPLPILSLSIQTNTFKSTSLFKQLPCLECWDKNKWKEPWPKPLPGVGSTAFSEKVGDKVENIV